MNQVYKNLALWMVIGLIVILLFTVFQGAQQGGQEQPNFSEFLKAIEQGRVDSIVIRGNLVSYTLKDSATTQRTYIVDYPDMIKQLRDRGVRIAVKPPDSNPWYAIFLQWVPMLLFIGVWIFFMRQMQGGGAKALSFGKARARLISEKQNKVTFQDVAGVEKAKEELREIMEFLKDTPKVKKRGDQPSRRARPRAPPSRPLRQAGRGRPARRQGARGYPQGPLAPHPARAQRRPECPGARHLGLLRRGSRQPRERGGAPGGPAGQEDGRDDGLRECQGQGADGRGAALHDQPRFREAHDGVPRGRACARRVPPARRRPASQGDDHSARAGAGTDHAAAHGRPLQLLEGVPGQPDHDPAGRPRCRGDRVPAADDRCRERSREGDRRGAQDGLRVGDVGQDGAAHVREGGGARLPGPRSVAPEGLQRRDG